MLASISTDWILANLAAVAGVVIVVVGLAMIGLRDVVRLSPTRVMAIASVCFRQAIRRRVLWITPLVIGGILVVAQFERGGDPQDSVRHIAGYCLFATGTLVTVVLIVLACTNLPREIESRVVYTVATKPTTRLEIILGKIVGFSGVSLCILLIMGMFTLGYLHWLDWRTRASIREQLSAGEIDAASRPTLTYYADRGTLHARSPGAASGLLVVSHRPQNEQDIWIPGAREGEIRVPFTIDPGEVQALQSEESRELPKASREPPKALELELTIATQRAKHIPAPPTSGPAATRPAALPSVTVDLLNSRQESVVTWWDLFKNDKSGKNEREKGHEFQKPNGTETFRVAINSECAQRWLSEEGPNNVLITIVGINKLYEYQLRQARIIDAASPQARQWTARGPAAYLGRYGQYGQQLKGNQEQSQCVAVYCFRKQAVPASASSFPVELRAIIDSNREDTDEVYNIIHLQFHNLKSGHWSKQIEVLPESNRPSYVDVPAEAVAGGDFDVFVRMDSAGWITLRDGENSSIHIVLGDHSFAWNLAKSLSILWLMSVLVIVISIFCSTFLSWPIAVVLTLVILSGRWGTEQLGDMLRPGVGNDIVNQMMRGASPGTARAVGTSVDLLVQALKGVSSVLPDLSQFAAIQYVQRGVAVPPAVLWSSTLVAFGFGIPLMVLSYIFLRFKEVAP